MKCINKPLSIVLVIFLLFSFSGCKKHEDITSYKIYETTSKYNLTNDRVTNTSAEFFAKDLCIAAMEDIGTENVHAYVAGAAGAFNLNTGEVIYSQNMHEKMYPASTTKILTCLVALESANLDDYYTVSENALNIDKDSSVCKLEVGDVISLRDLCYGLMLKSGNDAAIAIAEGVAGDVDTFIDMMNKKAASIGATNSHFVTPNGLHDDEHYTSVYDMYLILNEAIKNPDFYTIFSARQYTASLTRNNELLTYDWTSTNGYVSGSKALPEGMLLLGGKTGTTGAAGYCLVLLTENDAHDKIVSIVFNADGRSNLYYLMNEILEKYAK